MRPECDKTNFNYFFPTANETINKINPGTIKIKDLMLVNDLMPPSMSPIRAWGIQRANPSKIKIPPIIPNHFFIKIIVSFATTVRQD